MREDKFHIYLTDDEYKVQTYRSSKWYASRESSISSLILRADPLFRILQKLHFCVGHVVAFFDIMKTQKSIRNYLPMGGPLFVYDECRLKLQDRFATAGPDGVFTGRFDLISYHENDK